MRVGRRSRDAALPVARRVTPRKCAASARNVLAPLAQRRQVDLDGVEAIEQILAEAPLRRPRWRRSTLVAESDAHVDAAHARRCRPRCELARLQHAQQLGLQPHAACWRSRRGTACRRRPARSSRCDRRCASVNAPRTWPNSSLSKTPSDRPPAFTATNGRVARVDAACSQRGDDLLAGAVLAR